MLIDVKQALGVMDEVVEEFGEDYQYPDYMLTCKYVKDGEPSCIVGQVLSRLGVPLDVLKEMDNGDESGINTYAGQVLAEASVFMTDDARQAFTCAQREQDNGNTWGYARDLAKGDV